MDKQIKELKNPIYLNNIYSVKEPENNKFDIDKVLNKEKTNTLKLSWNKLDKASKLQKLSIFANKYCEEEILSPSYRNELKKYFGDCLDRKKLQNNKEVIYNKEEGNITCIPFLTFNKITSRFTLKIDKTKTTKTSKIQKSNKKNNNKIEIEQN